MDIIVTVGAERPPRLEARCVNQYCLIYNLPQFKRDNEACYLCFMSYDGKTLVPSPKSLVPPLPPELQSKIRLIERNKATHARLLKTGAVIKKLREMKGVDDHTLARYCGFDVRRIRLIEAGETPMSALEEASIAEAFDITLQAFHTAIRTTICFLPKKATTA